MIRNLRFATRVLSARPMATPWISRPMLSQRFYSSEAAASSELVAALRSEHKVEVESAVETEGEDQEYFGEFLNASGFSVEAKPGAQEISLVRTAGDETVRVYFNIADAANFEHDAELEGENGEEVDDFESPIMLNVVIERPKGALAIEAIAQDSAVIVESVIPYESAKLATEETGDAEYQRRAVYQGPAFAVLDPSVQGAVQNFLESRKINGELAQFVAEFSTYKENQEYIEWLNKIADIVEQE